MPEGDTIFRTAVRLRPAMVGHRVLEIAGYDVMVARSDIVGHSISRVEARGKHLLIGLDDQRVIHSHMGMTGSWHIYAVQSPWRKPRQRAALVLRFDVTSVVCFTPKTLELLTATELRHHPWLSRLGPDVLSDDFDAAALVRRMRAYPHLPMGQAVMNQQIVCGIGNVYKSEILFLASVNPWRTVAQVSDETIQRVLEMARGLMRKNLDGRPRRTRFGHDGTNQWVYGRSGESCLKCGERIAMCRQGDLGRSTYWCPECQG